MSRRFSDLDSVYNRLVAANFAFTSLPATDELRKYAEWKQDPSKRELTEGAMPTRGRSATVGVDAFGFGTDDNKLLVKMSNRALTGYNALSSTIKAEAVLKTSSLDTYGRDLGFEPAKVVIAGRLAGTTKTSKITANKYKSTSGTSYTIPFGRKTSTQTEFEAQSAIILVADSTHVVTFKPERLGRV